MNLGVMKRTSATNGAMQKSGPIHTGIASDRPLTVTPRVKAALLVLFAGALLSIGLYRVHQRHQVIRVGYELTEARSEMRKLAEERNRLRVEESVLTSPARIERIAASLGMVRPSPNQLRIIPPTNSVALRE